MKVLLINGSPKAKGCTYTALTLVEKELNEQGIETELIQIGNKPVQDCIGCHACGMHSQCVFNDIVNEIIEKAKVADGFVFGSPVYYGHPSGQLLSIMDRLFFSATYAFTRKPGAVVTAARRAGTTSCLEDLEKPFGLAQMPAVHSTYWNMVHGLNPEQVLQDKEGVESMRNLGRNMAWLLRCIEMGKAAGVPDPEVARTCQTNFMR